MASYRLPAAVLTACAAAALWSAHADELSPDDQLRMLYSHRFTFNDRGIPLVTIEIMSGQEQVTVRADGGLIVRPFDGGAAIRAGDRWTLRVAAPTRCVAEIPEEVSDADAATLPVAGLTALYGLELLGRGVAESEEVKRLRKRFEPDMPEDQGQ